MFVYITKRWRSRLSKDTGWWSGWRRVEDGKTRRRMMTSVVQGGEMGTRCTRGRATLGDTKGGKGDDGDDADVHGLGSR